MTRNPDGSVTLALPPGVVRWTLTGPSIAGEVWAFDWWTSPGQGISSSAQFADIVKSYGELAASSGLTAKLCGFLPPAGGITELKGIYYRDQQVATYVASHVYNPALVGISNSHYPLQQALCVTLLTDRPGASFRGRMYLPACGIALDANRLFAQNLIKPTIDALALHIGAGYTVGIYGPPVVVSRTETTATQVKALRWDRRPDIQRRRANRQADGGRTTVAVGAA